MLTKIYYIKNKFSTENRKRILDNFFSLSLLQAAGSILPLITVPYLTRVLGVEKFGLLSFAQVFTGYFATIADYGFAYSATREVSINRGNPDKVSEIFSSVMSVKFVFLAASFFVMAGIVFSFKRFTPDWPVYYVSFLLAVGVTIFPTWFFQGIEQMRYVAVLNIAAKLFFTVMIFVVVKTSEDFLYVPFLNALGGIAGGGVAIFLAWKKFGIRLYLPHKASVLHQLRVGWHIFNTMIYMSLYTSANVFLLGLLTNNTVVGYFSAAEKLIKSILGLTAPITYTVYPHFSKLFTENAVRAKVLLKKMLIFFGLGAFVVSVTIAVTAQQIVAIVFGQAFSPTVPVLRIMGFVIFATAMNHVLGVQGLMAFGYEKKLKKIVGACALSHLCLFVTAVSVFGLIAAPVVMLFTELLIALIELPVLIRYKLI